MARQAANRQILRKIEGAVEAAPDMNFWDILESLNVVIREFDENGMGHIRDDRTKESEKILKTINNGTS